MLAILYYCYITQYNYLAALRLTLAAATVAAGLMATVTFVSSVRY